MRGATGATGLVRVEESQLSFSQISSLSLLAACTTVAQRKERMPRVEFQFQENEQIRIQIQTEEISKCREGGN